MGPRSMIAESARILTHLFVKDLPSHLRAIAASLLSTRRRLVEKQEILLKANTLDVHERSQGISNHLTSRDRNFDSFNA